MTRDAPRALVVGGGVIGLACAYYLRRGGAEVTILERARVGAGASSGNAGCIAAGHPPLNRPGRVRQAVTAMLDPASPLYVKPRWDPALWRWLLGFARYCTDAHVAHCMEVMAPLGTETLRLFEELIREERIECGYRAEGFYDVCATAKGLAGARHEASLVRDFGYGPEELDGDDLRAREPALGPSVIGGVFYPEAGSLDPGVFLDKLRSVLRAMGVDVREGIDVQDVHEESGRVRGVRTRSGESIGADAVVLATGPFSLRVTRRFGLRIPVQPGKGYHRDIPVGPNGAPALGIACVLNESSVFCTPMDTFVRFAGTMEFSGQNEVMRPPRLAQLTRAARASFPELGPARPVSEWCGLRPVSVDGLPVVGPVPGVDGLHVATGHGMLGVTLAPVTGRIVAEEVLSGPDTASGALHPARFL